MTLDPLLSMADQIPVVADTSVKLSKQQQKKWDQLVQAVVDAKDAVRRAVVGLDDAQLRWASEPTEPNRALLLAATDTLTAKRAALAKAQAAMKAGVK